MRLSRDAACPFLFLFSSFLFAYMASLISSQRVVWQFMTYEFYDFLWTTSNTIPYVTMTEGWVEGMSEGCDKTTVQNDYTFCGYHRRTNFMLMPRDHQ
ncbi:hypothetical protein B0I37DRAFT_228928 [Chaetomium sp. MPI-CAGE-AT-0009]|nr:hypothetical protein B0I37DRAFT_228928 [Chaetomium sp. MPI-CAGE-AT-0009]